MDTPKKSERFLALQKRARDKAPATFPREHFLNWIYDYIQSQIDQGDTKTIIYPFHINRETGASDPVHMETARLILEEEGFTVEKTTFGDMSTLTLRWDK